MTMPKHSYAKNPRYTFGFLAYDLNDSRFQQMWLGALDAARTRDVNIICYAAGNISSAQSCAEEPRAALCPLIDPAYVDGLITAQFWGSEAWFEEFYAPYQPLPVVVIGRHYRRYAGVKGDAQSGLEELLRHLIVEHGYRRIGYTRVRSYDLETARYQTYCACLNQYGLTYDPRLVTLPNVNNLGHFAWGQEQVRLLFEERRLIPGQDIEVLVTYDDEVALGVLEALRARGIQAPEDLAVTGFDSVAEAELSTPPLTTTSNARYEHGWRAVEKLLAVLNGEQDGLHEHLTLHPIIRESCGCLPDSVNRAGLSAVASEGTGDLSDSAWPAQILRAFMELTAPAGTPFVVDIERIAAAFRADMLGEHLPAPSSPFLNAFKAWLYRLIQAGAIVDLGQDLISVLRANSIPNTDMGSEQDGRRERLFHQARALVWEVGRWGERLRQHQIEQQNEKLRQIGQQLTSIFDIPTILNVLAEELPRLNIPGCVLALYDDPGAPAVGARMVLAYTDAGRLHLEPDEQPVTTQQGLPFEILLDRERQASVVVEPLFFGQQHLGFVLFEVGPREGAVYESLRKEISSVLQGIRLVQQVRQNAAEIARQKYIWDTFMANVPDGIYFKDRDSRMLQINQSLATRLGLKNPAEAIGKTDFDLFPEEHARLKYEADHRIIQTGQPMLAQEESGAGGRWVLTTKMPLRDEHGAIIGTFGISRDITELKKAQQALQQAYSEISVLNVQLQQDNVRMSAELSVVKQLQQMILPRSQELTQIPGLDIVGYMQPADEVGGDYYDVLHDHGLLHIGIGDVTGHGLESGVLMLMTQTAIRTLIEHGETDPVKFVNTLNRLIYKNARRMGTDKNLTFALIQYQQGCLKVVGQHEELLVVRKSGQIERVETMDLGFPVGLEPEISQWVKAATITLQPGDGLVLYTDGITEAENVEQQQYGIERLCHIITQHWAQPAEAVKQAVIADVMTHIDAQTVYDDLTLVVLKQQAA